MNRAALSLLIQAGLDKHIDLDGWSDADRAVILMARRATEGNARSEHAHAALMEIGEALSAARGDIPQGAYLDGSDLALAV